jgi:hypothetical protein
VADTIRGFAASRASMITDRVGTGLVRALYSTYLSFLPPESFAYEVPKHGDPRACSSKCSRRRIAASSRISLPIPGLPVASTITTPRPRSSW